MSELPQVSVSALVEAWPDPALVVEADGGVVASNAAARSRLPEAPWAGSGLRLKDLGLDLPVPLSGPAGYHLAVGAGAPMEARQAPLGGRLFLISFRPGDVLQGQQSLLQNVMDSSPDLIFVKDIHLRTILCNQAFAAAVGKQPAELLGKTDLENGWDPELVKGNPAKGIRGFERDDRAALAGETIHNPADPANVGARIRIFDTIKLPLRNAAEQVIGVLGLSRDLTERRVLELALREKERLLSESQRLAHLGCWSLDLRESKLTWTEEAFRVFGVSPEAFTPSVASFLGLVHPEDRPGVQGWMAACLAGEAPGALEFRAIRPDGSTRILSGQGQLVRDEEGRPVRMAGTVQDITDRKALESTLQAGEERFRRMLSAAPVAFALNDPEGNITYLNEAFVRTFGYTLPEIPNLEAWWPRAYPDPAYRAWVEKEWRARLAEARETGRPFQEMELDIRCKDGQVRTVRAGASSLEGSFEGNHLVTLVDLTDQKKAEEERRQFELHLQHTQKLDSLGSLAGGVAHDMNNVLAAILSIAELHQTLAGEGDRLRRDMDIILKACVRGRSLVQGLLDFSRKGLGQVQVLDLNHLIREEAALLERTTLQKVTLQTELDLNLRYMEGDPVALSQALMNLCVNAVQAMPGGGTLTLRTRNEGAEFLVLEVEDTGSGMSPEVAARAMDPFFTTKPPGEGTGLGLSMVYGTVKAHGGSVDIKSVPGRGTLVTLRLKALEATPDQGHLLEPSPCLEFAGLKILVVDDDDLVQEALERLLVLLGTAPGRAGSGPEALARLASGELPDLVILDINMPGMDGHEVLARIREAWPDLPVLMASGRPAPGDLERLAGHPKVRFISKPFTLPQIQAELAWLRASQAEPREP